MSAQKEKRTYPRAPIKWYVTLQGSEGEMDGITTNVSPNGVFIRCKEPLKLNEVFDMVIDAPNRSLKVTVEVVWSNRYGPDDEVTPRGMGVRFLHISGEDRRFIAKASLEYLKEELAPDYLKTLELEIGEY